jgi:pilus assembly protein CpaF
MFSRRKTETAEPSVATRSGDPEGSDDGAPHVNNMAGARALLKPIIDARIDSTMANQLPRRDIALEVKDIISEVQQRGRLSLNILEIRDLVTLFVNELLGEPENHRANAEPETVAPREEAATPTISPAGITPAPAPASDATPDPAPDAAPDAVSETTTEAAPGTRHQTDTFEIQETEATYDQTASSSVDEAKDVIQPILMERIDAGAASEMSRGELARQINDIVAEIRSEQKLHLNLMEQRDLVTMLINDMLGLGPLEPLLADDEITDIMVNGPNQVYVERRGKLELTTVKFQNNAHVQNIASRIVTAIGRRVDESSPLVDARLEDGSRVNIIIPPLAIDGASISIRKFSKKSITLDIMAGQQNISPAMATVMKVAARSQLNILISGGTGSGKTTLLNAMSQLIDHGERIVTIEDAAELQLQQPHVVRLETRPANLEGQGEITMRDLVKNALRMRPDRIILGEVRGSEAVDMLQAMNTGHDGSMCTVHANRPREALTRLENMVGMAGINLPSKAVRTQIAAAIDLIVQISRMRDGVRRITSIAEVVGMEEDVITTQELFTFQFEGEIEGKLTGSFKSGGIRPHFTPRAEYFSLDRMLLEAI